MRRDALVSQPAQCRLVPSFCLLALLAFTVDISAQEYIVCKVPKSRDCLTWLNVFENNVDDSQKLDSSSPIAKTCYLSDLTPVSPNGDIIEVRQIFGDGAKRRLRCKINTMMEVVDNWWSVGNAYESARRVRRQATYSPRGRFRGQTQSQYLAIDRGSGKDEGKAEAHSAADSSRATVSGNSGMGQAQSQSMYDPSCEDCIGRSDGEASSLRRPGQTSLHSNIPGANGYASTGNGPGGYGGPKPYDNGGNRNNGQGYSPNTGSGTPNSGFSSGHLGQPGSNSGGGPTQGNVPDSNVGIGSNGPSGLSYNQNGMPNGPTSYDNNRMGGPGGGLGSNFPSGTSGGITGYRPTSQGNGGSYPGGSGSPGGGNSNLLTPGHNGMPGGTGFGSGLLPNGVNMQPGGIVGPGSIQNIPGSGVYQNGFPGGSGALGPGQNGLSDKSRPFSGGSNWPSTGTFTGPDGVTYYCCVAGPNNVPQHFKFGGSGGPGALTLGQYGPVSGDGHVMGGPLGPGAVGQYRPGIGGVSAGPYTPGVGGQGPSGQYTPTVGNQGAIGGGQGLTGPYIPGVGNGISTPGVGGDHGTITAYAPGAGGGHGSFAPGIGGEQGTTGPYIPVGGSGQGSTGQYTPGSVPQGLGGPYSSGHGQGLTGSYEPGGRSPAGSIGPGGQILAGTYSPGKPGSDGTYGSNGQRLPVAYGPGGTGSSGTFAPGGQGVTGSYVPGSQGSGGPYTLGVGNGQGPGGHYTPSAQGYIPGLGSGQGSTGQYIPGSGDSLGGSYSPGVGVGQVPSGSYLPGGLGSSVPYGPGVGGSQGSGGPYAPGVGGSQGSGGPYAPGVGGSQGSGGPYAPGVGGSQGSGGPYAPGVGGSQGSGGPYAPGVGGSQGSGGAYAPGVGGSQGSSGPYAPGVGGGQGAGGPYAPGVGGSHGSGGPYAPGVGGSQGSGGPYASGVGGGQGAGGPYAPGVGGSQGSGGPYAPGVGGSQGSGGPYASGVGGSQGSGGPYAPGVGGSQGSGGPYPSGVGGSQGSGGPYAPGVGGSQGSGGPYAPGVGGSQGSGGPYAPGVGGSQGSSGPYAPGVGGSQVSSGPYGPGVGGSQGAGGPYGQGVGGSQGPGGPYAPGVGGTQGAGGPYGQGVGGSQGSGGPYAPGVGGSQGSGGPYAPGVGGSQGSTSPYVPGGGGQGSGGPYTPGIGSGQYAPGIGNGQGSGGSYAPSTGGNQGVGGNGQLGYGYDKQLGQDGQSGIPQNVIDPNSIADGDDSEAEASVSQAANGTIASASSRGGNDKGRAQTNVHGTYTGSGSFAAQAEITGENKAANSEVAGDKKGASSNAQGSGRNNKSQANVKLGSETGSVLTGSQSEGTLHSSNTQVQGSVKGGMADAQARGPGSTSSQAQIGFTPYKDGDKSHDLQKTPFAGGGIAAAQSSGRTGKSQSQLHGTFKYGITYNGAAQAGASLNKDTVFPDRLPFDKIDVFDQNNTYINVDPETEASVSLTSPAPKSEFTPTTDIPLGAEFSTATNKEETIENSESTYDSHTHDDHHKPDDPISAPTRTPPVESRRSFQPTYSTNSADYEYSTDKDYGNTLSPDDYDVDDGFGPEGNEASDAEQSYVNTNYNEFSRTPEATHQSLSSPKRKGIEVRQTAAGNTQHILLGSLGDQDAEITQRNSQRPDESRVYQPGERIPGTGGYTIPIGFTGSVKSVASKDKTYVVGSKEYPSQAQTVSLSPGSGKIKYKPPAYGRNISPKNLRSLYHSKPDDNNRYVSVSKSVTRDLDGENHIRKQYSHTYYTKSSSCGYFTFTCTMVSSAEGKKKVCKPKIPTNPDGSPMRC